ncbi:hypothetical protein KJ969_03015 [Patescibacteria group bacterium]|nr:hypothetical protein [Patescibacteria group bacterium]MBU1921944.1 hypothetical protein [Patescibacteria group bacterium]
MRKKQKGFNFDFSRLIFWLVFSGASFILLLLMFIVLMPPESGINIQTGGSDELNKQVVEARYKHDIKELLNDYLREIGDLDELVADVSLVELTTQTKNQALELFVSADLKDIHLDIVVSLNYLEAGFAGDEQKLELGKLGLKEIFDKNSWLLNK